MASSNASDNSNSTVKDIFGSQHHKTIKIAIIITMIVISLIGNITVCCRLFPNRRNRYAKATILFLNLAVADLLVTFVTMTSQLVWEIMDRSWIADDAFCRIFKVLQTFALVSSRYLLVSIALDRHFAVVHPLTPCLQPTRLALLARLFSLLPSLPNLYFYKKIKHSGGRCYCTLLHEDQTQSYRQLYTIFVFLSIFFIPLLLLISLYSRILIEIWKQSSAMDLHYTTASTLPRAKVKTLKMSLTILMAFIITHVPSIIEEFVIAFSNQKILDSNLVALLDVISASNSALNPYIYLTFHAKGKYFVKKSNKDGISCLTARSTDTLRTTLRSTVSNKKLSNPRITFPVAPFTITHDSVVHLNKWSSIEVVKLNKNLFT
ncbi:adipokinetic hormone/corazonin-related peptide receptor variant I-like [Centruroides vittatus]|uniref:adipokinetic hormone/corazonin-related peptide receptor variant I-like n=1 Tax=Centruroides vittatus TaxID=120091 RepID=UPI0035101BD2